MGKKILLFANTDWYLYNFRLPLIRRLRDGGWDVVAVSPGGSYGEKLSAEGIRWIPFEFSTGGTNPLSELSVILRLVRLYRSERPDIVHHFTIKCLLYGTLAVRMSPSLGKTRIVNSFTGLGHVFTDRGIKAAVLRTIVWNLYRFTLGSQRVRVIFQNSGDMDFLVQNGLLPKERTVLIRGSGVDCEKFRPVEAKGKNTGIRVLFASRMMREKGIMELLEAARSVKAVHPEVEFDFAGDIYPGNPSSLDEAEIGKIKDEGVVNYLGHVEDMPSLLAASDIVVLPSYREGTPKILLEAAAMQKPIVATEIPGILGVVKHNVNGLLVPPRSSSALGDAILRLVSDPALRASLGENGRKIILDEFEESIVNKRTMELY